MKTAAPTQSQTVIHVVRSLPVGGVESMLARTLPLFPTERYAPRVVCLESRGAFAQPLTDAGVPVDFVSVPKRTHPLGLLRLARYFHKMNPRIIHTHMFSCNVTGTIAARMYRANIPVVCHVHMVSEWESKSRRRTEAFLDPWRRKYIAVSHDCRAEMLKLIPGISQDKVSVVFNSAGDIPKDADRAAMRSSLGIAPDEFVFGMVARMSREKCPQDLIRSFAIVHAQLPKTRLVIVGDGPELASCIRLADTLNVAQHVHFAGNQFRVQDYYALFDCFCLTSCVEAFGLVLVEAMQFELPIAATLAGGIPEVARDGREALLVPPCRPEAMSEAMLKIAQDESLRTILRNNGIRRAGDFSSRKFTSDLCDLYDSL